MSVYTANYLEEKKRRDDVVEMMRMGNWRGVMDTFHSGEESRDPLLVWIRPTVHCLNFIKQQINSLGVNSISSIGCGCGLLEWLLQQAIGINITGYEVNRNWWEGNHSIPHFIDMKYVDELEDKSCVISSDNAIMFCYFNNLQYFEKYLQAYRGSCVILIGPENNNGGRHCEPEPLYLEEQNSPNWRLISKFRLDGDDLIAVYQRKESPR